MEQVAKSKSFRWTVVLPIIMIEYILAMIDRTNISFGLEGMQKTFGMDPGMAGFISGLFFVGYVLLQLPAGHLASRVSATRNILVLSILWGVFSAMQGIVTSVNQLIIVRFLLGVVEGGMFPSIYVVLTKWFPAQERGRASSFFTFYVTVAPLIMSPICGWIVSSVDWFGVPGWRWLFILEGLPGALWGIFFWLVVPDSPDKASSRQISEAERSYLVTELAKEAAQPKAVTEKSYWKAALNPTFVFFTLSHTGVLIGMYGTNIWLPVIIKSISNFGYTAVGFIAAIPWLFATIAMIMAGIVNDRWGNKKALIVICNVVSGIAFLGITLAGTNNLWLSMTMISIATAGIAAGTGVYYSMFPQLFSKEIMGGLIGIQAAISNLGGFIGPFITGALMSGGNKLGGMIFLSGMMIMGAILILFCRVYKENTEGKSGQVTG